MILNLPLGLALLGGTWASMQQEFFHDGSPATVETQFPINFTGPFLDFRRDDVPAEFADSHPKRWGEELASIRLTGAAEPLVLNEAEMLLAVGHAEQILLYRLPFLRHVQTIRTFGRVERVAFMQDERMMVLSVHKIPDPEQPIGRWQSVTRLLDLKYELSRPFSGVDANSSSEWLTTDLEAQMKEHSLWYTRSENWDRPTFINGGTFFVAPPNSDSLRAVINSTSLEEKFVLPADVGKVSDISPDNRFLISQSTLSEPISINVWDVKAGKLVHVLSPSQPSRRDSYELSIGRQSVTSVWDQTQLRTWNVRTGEPSHTISLRRPDIPGYKLWNMSPDGRYLALPDGNLPTIQIFDLKTGKVVAQGSISGLKQNHDDVSPRLWVNRPLQFDRRGRLFICAGRTTFVYDVKSNVKWQFEGPWLERSVFFNYIVVGKDSFITGDDDGVIRFWKF